MDKRAVRIILVSYFINIGIYKADCLRKQPLKRDLQPRKLNLPNIYPRGGSILQYKDVLNSQAPKNIRISDEESNLSFADQWDEPKDQRFIISRKNASSQTSNSLQNGNSHKTTKSSGNPVVYRYFGRNRARSVRAESIPFIIIGPCVDHWRLVGRILASRGFSVIAVERSKPNISKGINKKETHSVKHDRLNESEALVSSILEALKWQKAILVGCDQECVLALEAALRLPERVVGLVLCGDLNSVLQHAHHEMKCMKLSEEDSFIDTETFLQNFVQCPCQLICDGDIISSSNVGGGDQMYSISKKILGGGLAPHRRLPEQLSWLLTRFVEEKVSISSVITISSDAGLAKGQRSSERIFLPEMLLVTGRVLATALIYMSIAKVSLFQYKNIRDTRIQFDFSTIFNKSRKRVGREIMSIMYKLKRMIPFQYFITMKIFNRTKPEEIDAKIIKNDESDLNQNIEKDEDEMKSDLKNEIDGQEDKEEKNGLTSPLLQKLLFFDQIIS